MVIAIIIYCFLGLIFCAASVVKSAYFAVEEEKMKEIQDISEFKEKVQKYLGVSWKILSYIFAPFMFMAGIVCFLIMIISSLFKK